MYTITLLNRLSSSIARLTIRLERLHCKTMQCAALFSDSVDDISKTIIDTKGVDALTDEQVKVVFDRWLDVKTTSLKREIGDKWSERLKKVTLNDFMVTIGKESYSNGSTKGNWSAHEWKPCKA